MADIAIRCQGLRANGRPCRNLLGWLVEGLLRVKIAGRLVSDVQLATESVIVCEHCHGEWRPLFPEDTKQRV